MSNNELLENTRTALEAGDLSAARRNLRQLTRIEPDNYRAWLWLAGITDTPESSLEYAHRAAAIAPNDPTVKEALAWAEQRIHDATIQSPSSSSFAPDLPASTQTEPPSEEKKGWRRWFGIGIFLLLAFF